MTSMTLNAAYLDHSKDSVHRVHDYCKGPGCTCCWQGWDYFKTKSFSCSHYFHFLEDDLIIICNFSLLPGRFAYLRALWCPHHALECCLDLVGVAAKVFSCKTHL